jgi:hypothetical protein
MAGRKKTERKNDIGKTRTAALLTFGLIAAAIAIIAVSSIFLPGLGRAMREGPNHFEAGALAPPPPPENEIAFLEGNFALRFGLSALNVLLAIYLLFVYVKDYLSLRSTFTLGLVAFLFSFLLYALTSFPLVRMVMGEFGFASSLSFVPMLFSAMGLLIFAKLSNE